MLVPFTIDPDMFTGNIEPGRAQDLEWVLKEWQRVGVLVILSDTPAESLLYKAISTCNNAAIRQKWSAALVPGRLMKFYTNKKIESLWSTGNEDCIYLDNEEDRLQVLIINEKNASKFKLKLTEIPKERKGGDFLCFAKHFSRLTVIEQTNELMKLSINSNEDNSIIWKTRYRALVKYSKLIYIYDRFCAKNFIDSNKNNRTDSGIEQMIIRISTISATSCKYVKIRSAIQLESRNKKNKYINIQEEFRSLAKEIEAEFRRTFSKLIGNSALKEIEINLIVDDEYGSIEHYRHIRFDDHKFIIVDKGLSHFSGDRAKQTTPFLCLPWNSAHSKSHELDEKLLDEKYMRFGYSILLN